MDTKPTAKQAVILSAIAVFALAFVSAPALAGEKVAAPGSKYFGEVEVKKPLTGPISTPPTKVPAVQLPAVAPGAVPNPGEKAGMWLMKSPMPTPPGAQGAGLPSPGLPSPGLPKGQAAPPLPPKNYSLDPEAGEVKFGDGEHGARLPSGKGVSAKYRTGQGAVGALPLPPPPGAAAELRGIALPEGTSPGASHGGDTVPTEDLSLNFEEVKPTYAPQSSGKGGGNVETEWKVEEGEK